MPGFNVKLDLEKAVRDAAEAFETLGSGGAFARAVAYSLNGVVMDGVGRFRDHMPQIWKYANAFTKRGLWYDIDPNLLDRIPVLHTGTGINTVVAGITKEECARSIGAPAIRAICT